MGRTSEVDGYGLNRDTIATNRLERVNNLDGAAGAPSRKMPMSMPLVNGHVQ